MKPEEIKGMARNILSDGKIKETSAEDDGLDEMGQPEHMSVEFGDGGGGMVSTRFKAKQPYKEGNEGSLTQPAEHKQAFSSHEELAAHVGRIGRLHGKKK